MGYMNIKFYDEKWRLNNALRVIFEECKGKLVTCYYKVSFSWSKLKFLGTCFYHESTHILEAFTLQGTLYKPSSTIQWWDFLIAGDPLENSCISLLYLPFELLPSWDLQCSSVWKLWEQCTFIVYRNICYKQDQNRTNCLTPVMLWQTT